MSSNGTKNGNSGGKEIAVTRDEIAEISQAIDSRMTVFRNDLKGAGDTTKALYTATCIKDLRTILMKPAIIMLLRSLIGTPLGFLSDIPNKKDQSVYDDWTLVTCATEALVRGFYLTGNEFNIIAGRFYAAKAGLQRKVYSLPGIDGFSPQFSVPVKSQGDSRFLVTGSAKFTYAGKPVEFVRTFAVTVFDGNASTDAALGKAERKYLAALWAKLTNEFIPEGDPEDSPATADAQPAAEGSKTADLATKMGVKPEAEVEKPKADPVVTEEPKAIEGSTARKSGSIFDQLENGDGDKEKEYARAAQRDEERRAHEATR